MPHNRICLLNREDTISVVFSLLSHISPMALITVYLISTKAALGVVCFYPNGGDSVSFVAEVGFGYFLKDSVLAR